jgi:GNAT superfamily N-acetyltransferase
VSGPALDRRPVVYRETPRSYWSLLWFVAVLLIGFVIDLAFGGGIPHLVGWLVALAIVVGLNFIVVYAVRSEKSLLVTADELRIGDDAVGRAEVVGFAAAIDEDDVPVLGWPGGKPRSLRGVTLRLSDGSDVVVPTRYPDRLRAALELGDDVVPAMGQEVRAAARSEYAELAEIDERAETLFRLAGYDLPDVPYAAGALAKARAVFVAGRPAVGYVWVDEVDGLAHVHELAVIPKWMRQGIGSRLLERACSWARDHGYPAITLLTYADVPWNAPYYRGRGFVELAELTRGLAALRQHEIDLGLDAVGRRVAMRRDLATESHPPR